MNLSQWEKKRSWLDQAQKYVFKLCIIKKEGGGREVAGFLQRLPLRYQKKVCKRLEDVSKSTPNSTAKLLFTNNARQMLPKGNAESRWNNGINME